MKKILPCLVVLGMLFSIASCEAADARTAAEVAEMVYDGFWFCPKFDALLAFIREAQRPVTGSVTLKLYKGNISVEGRRSPNSLYDAEVASMEGGGSYNQDDAEGFLRIMGLPGRVQGSVSPREY